MSIFNVKEFGGAQGNGSNDDSAAILKTIKKASETGGVAYFPRGVYRLGKTIEINDTVKISGSGWETRWDAKEPKNVRGSWLFVDNPKVSAFKIRRAGGTIIRDIAVAHDQPSNTTSDSWKPFPYEYAIDIDNCSDVLLEHIHLHNPTKGIVIHVGRHTLDKISGNPLEIGILVRNSRDVLKINDVHFWRFWSGDFGVALYTAKHGVAIRLERADNPMLSNIFAIGYAIGMHITKGKQADVTKRFQINTLDFDSAVKGIVIDHSHITGQILNYTYKGRDIKKEGGVVDGHNAVHIDGGDVRLQLTNANISTCKHNAIRVSGDPNHFNTKMVISNALIDNYDFLNENFPGIEALNKATIHIGASVTLSGKDPKIVARDESKIVRNG